ncbi:hypothetical protein PQX77_002629 [Marasmius sp. AFHP31]|nr:hypothetical protein PQX77_002629 [Marasmius sp. AFHP31]
MRNEVITLDPPSSVIVKIAHVAFFQVENIRAITHPFGIHVQSGRITCDPPPSPSIYGSIIKGTRFNLQAVTDYRSDRARVIAFDRYCDTSQTAGPRVCEIKDEVMGEQTALPVRSWRWLIDSEVAFVFRVATLLHEFWSLPSPPRSGSIRDRA